MKKFDRKKKRKKKKKKNDQMRQRKHGNGASLTWLSHGGCVDRGLETPRFTKEIGPGRLRAGREEIERGRCRRTSLIDAQSNIVVPGFCC